MYLAERVHKEGQNGKYAMWPRKVMGASTYRKEIDADEKRSRKEEGRHATVSG